MLLLLRKYHPHISIHFHLQNHLKNILLLIRGRITKNISVFPCEINAQVILLLPLAILSHEMSALKKREKYEEIKRSKCSEPRKKRESETRGKNGQVSDSRIRGARYPPKRKEKEEHLILLIKFFKKARKVCIPSKEQSRIRLPPLLSPSSPYTIHSPHMHILIKLIGLFLWIHGLTMQYMSCKYVYFISHL